MRERLEQYLLQNAYIPIKSNLNEFAVFFKKESNFVNVIQVIDYTNNVSIDERGYHHIQEQVQQLFLDHGMKDPHVMVLVITDRIEEAEAFCRQDQFCWIIDSLHNNLYIPPGHVVDFYGLKGRLEDFLEVSEQYDPEQIMNNLNCQVNYYKEQQKKKIPGVNIAIVVLNVLIFILCAFTGDLLYNKGAFSIYLIAENHEYFRFISSMFLHADSNHLISNMLVLLFMGDMVEEKIGHLKYAMLYMISGIGGGILSAIYELVIGKAVLSVGASGAIFGIVGAVLVLVVVHRGKWESITLPRVIFMLAYSLYTGFTAVNVNNAAHIGGLLTGAIVMILFYFVQRMIERKQEASHEN